MKKSISIIAAAAMAASLTLAGTMSAFAADEEPTTQASTEAATEAEPSIKIADIVGKWKYQVADGDTSVDKAAKDNGVVEISDDGTYSYTDADGKNTSGTVEIKAEELNGTYSDIVNFYIGEEFSFGGYYRSADEISIGNGGISRLIRDNGEAVETSTTTEGETTTTTTTTTSSTTTSKTTTGKATTTSANSPKTGVAFPALAVAGIGAAIATAFVLRKKED
ncbi:MAG: NPXTG-anchored protein [Ruminococcus sp.]|nr:NPXTG-anchored protein [Ruminococcus sp.]